MRSGRWWRAAAIIAFLLSVGGLLGCGSTVDLTPRGSTLEQDAALLSRGVEDQSERTREGLRGFREGADAHVDASLHGLRSGAEDFERTVESQPRDLAAEASAIRRNIDRQPDDLVREGNAAKSMVDRQTEDIVREGKAGLERIDRDSIRDAEAVREGAREPARQFEESRKYLQAEAETIARFTGDQVDRTEAGAASLEAERERHFRESEAALKRDAERFRNEANVTGRDMERSADEFSDRMARDSAADAVALGRGVEDAARRDRESAREMERRFEGAADELGDERDAATDALREDERRERGRVEAELEGFHERVLEFIRSLSKEK
jgi:hypothetical protein